MLKNVFDVTIRCVDNSTSEYSVIAKDDQKAREAAIKHMIAEYKKELLTASAVDYCEISLARQAI